MGYILLTGIVIVIACLLTIKGFKKESTPIKIFHMGSLLIGITLIALSIIGIIALGDDIVNY